MEYLADSVRACLSGFVHEVSISFGHFKRTVAEPVGDCKLALSTFGKPGGISMPERMKNHFLASVSNSVIETQGLNGLTVCFGHIFHRHTAGCGKNQVRAASGWQISERVGHFSGHDRISGMAAFGVRDKNGHCIPANVIPSQFCDFAKSQTAMQADKRHYPTSPVTGCQFRKQLARLIWRKKSLTFIIQHRQGNVVERQRPLIYLPFHHAICNASNEGDSMFDSLRRVSIMPHFGHKLVKSIGGYLIKRQRGEVAQNTEYKSLVSRGMLIVRFKPVSLVGFPRLKQSRSFLFYSKGNISHGGCGLGFIYKTRPHFGCKSGGKTLTSPSNILSDAHSCGIPIINCVAYVGTPTIAALATFPCLNARIFGGFSNTHIATPLRPCGENCDHFATIHRTVANKLHWSKKSSIASGYIPAINDLQWHQLYSFASQAGRCGFKSRFPLQLYQAVGVIGPAAFSFGHMAWALLASPVSFLYNWRQPF